MSVQKFTIKDYEINTYNNAKEIQEHIDALFVASELIGKRLDVASIEDYFHKQIMIAYNDEPLINITINKVTNLIVGFVLPAEEIYDELETHQIFNENTIRAYLPDQLQKALTILSAKL